MVAQSCFLVCQICEQLKFCNFFFYLKTSSCSPIVLNLSVYENVGIGDADDPLKLLLLSLLQ